MNVPENAIVQSFLPEQRPRHVSKTAIGNKSSYLLKKSTTFEWKKLL